MIRFSRRSHYRSSTVHVAPHHTARRLGVPIMHPHRVRGHGRVQFSRVLRRGPAIVLRTDAANHVLHPSRNPRLRIRLRIDIVLPLVLLLLSLIQNLGQVDVSPFHRDEARWIGRAHFLEQAFDPFSATWNDFYLTSTQPPFGSYVMGLGLVLQGRDLTTNSIWDFNFSQEWNEQTGAMPEAGDLNAGRRMNALLGALITLTVYFIGRQLSNRVGATIGALFIALHPLQILLASQALSDVTLTLLLALLFLAGMRLARYPTWTNAIIVSALIGMGGSAKLAPLLLSLPLAGLGAFLLARSLLARFTERSDKDRTLGFRLLPIPIMSFIFFIASYPYLWVDPIRRSYKMFSFRVDEMQSQGTIWPGLAVDSPLDALARIGIRLGETSTMSGRLAAAFLHLMGIDGYAIPSGLDFLPAIAGIVILGALVIKHGLRSKYAVISLLMISEAGAIAVGMKADFNRYHLPIVLIMSICIGVTASSLWSLLAKFNSWRLVAALPGVHIVDQLATKKLRPVKSPKIVDTERQPRQPSFRRCLPGHQERPSAASGTD